ncbi:MAG: acetyl-CoA carboxylase biotin carboxyl carrier protein [Eubacteriales bacterium]
MKFEQLIELIKTVSSSELTTFKYEEGDMKLLMRSGENMAIQTGEVQQVTAPQFVTSSAVTGAQSVMEVGEVGKSVPEGNVVTCPLVGTFYSAPSEEAETFVKLGDSVKKGQVLAIVEAMKLMNEIESEYDGTVVDILVNNEQGVDYGQPLFVIK